MPSYEFDGMDYFTSTMPPAPAPSVLAYFDSWASPESLVAQLPAIAEGMVTASGRSLVPVSLAYDGVERGTALEPFGPAAISELAGVVATPGFHHFGLGALKKVLGPALLPTPFRGYDGYPIRIVPDPGTAFRRVAADEPRPRLSPGEGPMPDGLP